MVCIYIDLVNSVFVYKDYDNYLYWFSRFSILCTGIMITIYNDFVDPVYVYKDYIDFLKI